jgi:hypothetical protein
MTSEPSVGGYPEEINLPNICTFLTQGMESLVSRSVRIYITSIRSCHIVLWDIVYKWFDGVSVVLDSIGNQHGLEGYI